MRATISSMGGFSTNRSRTGWAAVTREMRSAADTRAGSKLRWTRGPSRWVTTASGIRYGGVLVEEVNDEKMFRGDAAAEFFERAVGQYAPVVDDDDPFAERFDVVHVVGGQDDGYFALLVEAAYEVPEGELGNGVQADSRLVQKEYRGGVEQRGGEVAAHTLSQAQLANGGVEQRFQREGVYEFVAVSDVLTPWNAVDVAQEVERLDDGPSPTIAACAVRRRLLCG